MNRPTHAHTHLVGTAGPTIEDPQEDPMTTTAKTTTPAPATNVVPMATVQAAGKRRKLTGEDWKTRREFAQSVVGYDKTSPIYGKQMPEVLELIENKLVSAKGKTGTAAVADIDEALVVVDQLKRRIATRKIMAQG